METLLYIGKVSLFWALFYSCYFLLLRRQTFFVWNRVYLIGALAVSLVLPFVHYSQAVSEIAAVPAFSYANETISNIKYQPVAPTATTFSWVYILYFVYVLGAITLLTSYIRKLHSIYNLLRSSEAFPMDGYTLYINDDNNLGSFSFCKSIVLSRQDFDLNRETILPHELVHVQQMHSLDILFVAALKVIFWFNPLVWLYERAIQEVHEFLADEPVQNREYFSEFLVAYTLKTDSNTLSHSFYRSSQIKKRILMLYTKRTQPLLKVSYLFALIAIAILSVSMSKVDQSADTRTKGFIVRGYVMDQATKLALLGTQVRIVGSKNITLVGEDGEFEINAKPNDQLQISKTGYNTVIRPLKGVANQLFQLKQVPGLKPKDISQKAEAIIDKPKNKTSIQNQDKDDIIRPDISINSGAPNAKMPNILPEMPIDEGQPVEFKSFLLPNFTISENNIEEITPTFPGGEKAFKIYIDTNMKYPKPASRGHVSGNVFVSFTVKNDGTITDVKILKGLGFGCDTEATRLVLQSPKWKPATVNGVATDSQTQVEIQFKYKE